jgi:hypothetical protein
MKRPVPTPVMHFTHVESLLGIVARGLASDRSARSEGSVRIDVGEPSIKAARRQRVVKSPPGGVVADYVLPRRLLPAGAAGRRAAPAGRLRA